MPPPPAASRPPRAPRARRFARWCGPALAWLLCLAPAWAQERALRRFDIAPQALEQALLAFSEQAGLDLVAVGDLGGPYTTPAVRGEMASGDALARLLAGTGLGYRVRGDGVVLVARRRASATSAGSTCRSR
ncbi:STN domain-containing protein [Luteimonas huabeiensis]|uniref:STN domain-containing protein n=1 Tax=Luteimonas huabeiensis TaxID=1244513 RepID=UPI0004644996|nr:STN domain-containing protein [Luteimonas huabeiensis]